MFLFAAERELSGVTQIRAELRMRGRSREVRSGGFIALWTEDGFTVGFSGRTIRIESSRPKIDRVPACTFLWRTNALVTNWPSLLEAQ